MGILLNGSVLCNISSCNIFVETVTYINFFRNCLMNEQQCSNEINIKEKY